VTSRTGKGKHDMNRLLPLFVIAMLILSACAQQTGPAKVTVKMSEWSVDLSQTSVPAGRVTFALKNDGKLTHELAILRTDLAHDKIPLRAEDPTKVQELGITGEIEDVDAGQMKEAVFELTPGNYVLVCNEASHYQAGMHVAFVVR